MRNMEATLFSMARECAKSWLYDQSRYVKGHESELGYFSLSELESVQGPAGLRIERDLHFSATLEEVMEGKRR